MNIVFPPKRSGNQSLCWCVRVSLLSFLITQRTAECLNDGLNSGPVFFLILIHLFIQSTHSFIHSYIHMAQDRKSQGLLIWLFMAYCVQGRLVTDVSLAQSPIRKQHFQTKALLNQGIWSPSWKMDYHTGESDYQTKESDYQTVKMDFQFGESDYQTKECDHQTGNIDDQTGESDYQIDDILRVFIITKTSCWLISGFVVIYSHWPSVLKRQFILTAQHTINGSSMKENNGNG